MKRTSQRFSLVILIIVLGLLAQACSSPTIRPATPTAGSEQPTAAVASPEAIATQTPTITPTPRPPRLVLLAPPGADQAQAQAVQGFLQGKAAEAGMQLLVEETLPAGNLDERVKIVVVLPPYAGLEALAASAPQVQFLAYSLPGLQPAANLAVISGQLFPDQAGFMAGYIAAMITTDWRVGSLTVTGETARRDAFFNGVIFFCGLCRQVYPPFYGYPLNVELAATSNAAERQAAVDYLVDHQVNAVYITPGLDDPQTLQALAEAGIYLIAETAPTGQAQEQWAVSLMADPFSLLEKAWAGLLASSPGQVYTTGMQLLHANEPVFSTGRQALAGKVLEDLLGGYIDTGVTAP